MDFNSDLIKEIQRAESANQDAVLTEAQELLDNGTEKLKRLLENEKSRVVSEKTIKKICLKYRLRFLPIEYFKGEIPSEAREEEKKLAEQYNFKNPTLKIIAPGSLFKLENREKDPILLAQLSPKTYLIIHKWGGEFSPMRVLHALPMRNVVSMSLSVGLAAFILSMLFVPFTGGSDLSLQAFLFGFGIIWMGCLSYALFLVLSQNIFPTTLIWNSKFLD